MKKYLVIVVFVCIMVTGCSRPEQHVELEGSVNANSKLIRLFGTSNVPENSEIKIELTELGASEPLESELVKVDKEGRYSWTLKRPEREAEYELMVTFLPEVQPKNAQEKYGELGQLIKEDSLGIFTYEKDGKKYTGIRKYDTIVKLGENQSGQRSLLRVYPRDM